MTTRPSLAFAPTTSRFALIILPPPVNGLAVVVPMLAVLVVYFLVCYRLHRFVLHGQWLYRMRWSAALWKRAHFEYHQNPHRLEVFVGFSAECNPDHAENHRANRQRNLQLARGDRCLRQRTRDHMRL